MTLHLYELSPAIKQLLDLMEDGEDPSAWTASLDELEEGFKAKAIGLATLVKTWEAQEAAYKTEMGRRQGHMKAAQGRQAWAKDYLRSNMEDSTITHVEGDLVDIKLQDGAPGVIVEDEALIPVVYKSGTVKLPWADILEKELDQVAEMTVNKKGMLEDFAKDSAKIPGVRIENGAYVVVR